MKTANKIRLARLAYFAVRSGRALLGRGDRLVVERGGLKYELDLCEGIDFAIFLLGAFERNTAKTLHRYVQPGMTVLDIGANIGAHTLNLGNWVTPGGRVLAFEPTEYAFKRLLQNIKLNPSVKDAIQCFQYFLTSGIESRFPQYVYSSWPLTAGNGRHELHMGEQKPTAGARAVSLDRVLADLAINKVHFIKIDVDGFESDVLEGAQEMLKRDKPILVAELAPYLHSEQGRSFDDFVDILSKIGYKFFDQRTGKPLPRRARDIEAQIGLGSSRNALVMVSG